MPVIQSLQELEESQKTNHTLRPWGLVPTMGALHQGHLSLIEQAAKENSLVWVSIFVNPTQFNDPNDLHNYPQTLELDIKAIQQIAPKAYVFVPNVELMYPKGLRIESYDFLGIDKVMEGLHRPGHFGGVATVVQRLLELLQPNKAYFGEKDFQQLKIVEQIGKKMRVDIQPCPIIREANGLAMSSRNQRLTFDQKEKAAVIFNILTKVKKAFGKASLNELHLIAKQELAPLPDFKLEYFEIAYEENLQKVQSHRPAGRCRAFISVWVDDVRLIDNMLLN